ncbi:MAG: hypothetical protein KF866_03020 [Phycisphaeraceae bacterium]|nr:hypothetical protein [Phycisphaeraceae bacterium]
MAARTVGILEIDGEWLSALLVRAGGDVVSVRSAAIIARPQDVDPSDAGGLAQWFSLAAEEAGFGRTPVLLVLPRRDVVLKRLITPGASDADLPGIVRLQMAKQLAVPGSGAAIDYLPEPAESNERSVLAGAMPSVRADMLKEVARRAGIRLAGLTLRCFATQPWTSAAEGLELIIQIGRGSTEFVLLERGRVQFARTVEWRRPDAGQEATEAAHRLSVEAKRMWMSYRLSHSGARLESIHVLGDDEAAKAAAAACAAALDLTTGSATYDHGVEWAEEIAPDIRACVGGLVRLVDVQDRIDFVFPRRAPDLHARKRQAVLLAILMLILVGGGGGWMAFSKLSSLRDEVTQAERRLADVEMQYRGLLLDKARLLHLRAWKAARPDWIAHLDALSRAMPSPADALLSSFRARMLQDTVQYTPADRGDAVAGEWIVPPSVSITLIGNGRSTEWMADVRRRLLELHHYTVSTSVADSGPSFDFRLLGTSWNPPADVLVPEQGANP